MIVHRSSDDCWHPLVPMLALLVHLAVAASLQAADRWPGETAPECVGMDSSRLAQIDDAVRDAIEQKKCPGAVVLVSRFGQVVWWRPYGQRLVGEVSEPMSRETVFDMASLTKVMATATSAMILLERGEFSVADRVSRYVPEFGQNGKEAVTVEQLLRHRAGFVADNSLKDYQEGATHALEKIWSLKPTYEPGSKFLYSDVGYIVLGELVRRVSGRGLDEFAQANIYRPLGMTETTFWPLHSPLGAAEACRDRCGAEPLFALRVRTAVTERREGRWMRGEVHDPRAYLLGGVAGHAGLFSTAADVATFAHMILCRGEWCGRRILAPETISTMTSPGDTPAGQARGLGWDIDTPFSSIRGDFFPVGGFGHTGFTGTSLWIDPASQTAVIILSNRVHPNGKGDVRELRKRVANIVAGSIRGSPAYSAFACLASGQNVATRPSLTRDGTQDSPLLTLSEPAQAADTADSSADHVATVAQAGQAATPGASPEPVRANPSSRSVLCGIDLLSRDGFRQLRGRKVGLITNHTGVDREGRSTIDILHGAEGVSLLALFSPEHGIRGQVDAAVSDSKDERTGLPIYSLYERNRRKPTAEQLRGIDTLVFDIQDIGCRFYTYSATLGLAMEAAAENKIKFIVLDRPNPIGGTLVEGPVLDAGRESFTGYHRIPVRHGMTLGELARLYNGERNLGVDLEVIPAAAWRRADQFDATGLLWINPSPNMRSLRQALLYPGIGLLETTNLSVGRGTDTPFEVLGAPWLDGRRLVAGLAQENLEGVVFVPQRFTPSSSVHAGKECGGVQVIVTDRETFRPVRTGLAIARQLRQLYPVDWQVDRFMTLLANEQTFNAVKQTRPLDEIEQSYRTGIDQFMQQRSKYLIY